jgi:solute carrier family 1 (high affinity glutamate transporter) protein 1
MSSSDNNGNQSNINDLNDLSDQSKITKSTKLIRFKNCLKTNLHLIFTISSIVIGISLGLILKKYTNLNAAQKQYFGFPGEIFLRMLKFIIFPLVMSSLICGIAGLERQKARKIVGKAFIYYFSTTVMAVVLGLILVSLFKINIFKHN